MPLTFVADASIDVPTVRVGSRVRVHLQSDLRLGTALLAAAGTRAELTVIEHVSPGTSPAIRIALGDFVIPTAQSELPLIPDISTIGALTVGTVIAAHSVGTVTVDADRTVIRVPLPFPLSTDAPGALFHAVPARTTPPVILPRRSPAPAATVSPPAAPPSGEPSPLPSLTD